MTDGTILPANGGLTHPDLGQTKATSTTNSSINMQSLVLQGIRETGQSRRWARTDTITSWSPASCYGCRVRADRH
jgi:hypothetical protein